MVDDYYSYKEGKPSTDVSIGGTSDVTAISGSRTATSTTLTFKRKLVTGDTYDRDISLTAQNDMIYAWGTASTPGLSYHGENHNHIFIDFTRPDGIPLTSFGQEESGVLSRTLVRDMYFGVLSTWQTEKAGAVSNYPFGSVVDIADDGTGRPLILMNSLERNVINMGTYPPCSLAIQLAPNTTLQYQHPELYDVVTKPRTTLLGTLYPVPADQLEDARAVYLTKHPLAKSWIGLGDFTLFTMNITDIYVIAGFGNAHYIGWIAPEQYLAAQLL